MKTILDQIEELRGVYPDAQIASAVDVAKSMCWQAWRPVTGTLSPLHFDGRGIFVMRYTDDNNQLLNFLVRRNGDVVASLRPRQGIEITFRQDGQCEGFAPTKQHEPDKLPLKDWVPLVASYDYDTARDSEPMANR